MTKTDLHIVLKNISDLLQRGTNEGHCPKGSIHISEENVQKIIAKLEAIESLFRQLAEQKQNVLLTLEAGHETNKSPQSSFYDSDSFESLEDASLEEPIEEPPLDEATTAELSLPVTSMEELERLNQLLGNGDDNLLDKFVSYLKTTHQPTCGVLEGVVDDTTLNETNWTGQGGKFEFRSFGFVLHCIHHTLLPDLDQAAFERAIKFEIARAHSRAFQARFEKHKLKKANLSIHYN